MIVSLYLLFEILSIIFCIHYLYDKKFYFDKVTIIFLIIELVWMHLVYYLPVDNSFSMVIYPIIAMYCSIKFGMKIKAIVINNVLYMIILSFIQATVMGVFTSFGGVRVIGEKESLLINIIVFGIVVVVLRRCKLYKLSNVLQSNDKIILLSAGVLLMAIVVLFLNYRSDKGLDVVGYAILIVSIILIVTSAIDIGKHKVRTKEIEAELRLHKLYEKSFQELIGDIRAKQHEFDNHINTIYSQHYLCHSFDELVNAQKKYCESIVQDNTYNKLLSKGNSIVIGFLYSKFMEAKKLGIEVEYKVRIGDFESDVPIYKIIELLGNLITNAIEALVNYDGKKLLKVVIIEQQYEIAIDISNTCKNINQETLQHFFVKGYSEKGKNRGYGLYNVKKICEEYNILLGTSIEKEGTDDRLHFTIIINKPF